MNTKVIIVGAALAFCGCAGIGKWTAVEPNRFTMLCQKRVNCRSLKIEKLFGLDDGVLSDTNRFCRLNRPCVYQVTLPDSFCGCRKFTVFLDGFLFMTKAEQPFRLRSVELKRTLRDEAGDGGLKEEFQATCEQVAKLLGVEIGALELVSPIAWRKSDNAERRFWGVRTDVTFDLAEGQYVSVRAIEAVYVKRGNDFILSSPAAIEINIMYDQEEIMRCLRTCDDMCGRERPKVEKAISIGPDCAELLSQAMIKEAARWKKLSEDESPDSTATSASAE